MSIRILINKNMISLENVTFSFNLLDYIWLCVHRQNSCKIKINGIVAPP